MSYTNYDAFRELHQARMQRARASAVASGWSQLDRSRRSPLRRTARLFGNKRRLTMTPGHSPETMLWA